MESIYTELAFYGSKNKCARTDNVYVSITEVCDGMVSLIKCVSYEQQKSPYDGAIAFCEILTCN